MSLFWKRLRSRVAPTEDGGGRCGSSLRVVGAMPAAVSLHRMTPMQHVCSRPVLRRRPASITAPAISWRSRARWGWHLTLRDHGVRRVHDLVQSVRDNIGRGNATVSVVPSITLACCSSMAWIASMACSICSSVIALTP
jgi:hypothetical protein